MGPIVEMHVFPLQSSGPLAIPLHSNFTLQQSVTPPFKVPAPYLHSTSQHVSGRAPTKLLAKEPSRNLQRISPRRSLQITASANAKDGEAETEHPVTTPPPASPKELVSWGDNLQLKRRLVVGGLGALTVALGSNFAGLTSRATSAQADILFPDDGTKRCLESGRGFGNEVTICIGDIHGQLQKLLRLWENLEGDLGSEAFSHCTVVFLGDFNDRGPDTKGVIEWLTTLEDRYPSQKHVFLAGNHDFSFAACIDCLPPAPEGFSFKSTWEDKARREPDRVIREGWWNGKGVENVHLQARRWAGEMKAEVNEKRGSLYLGSTYDAEPTFTSYGVKHGDREGLIAAVPEHHKAFIRKLSYVYEQPGPPGADYTKLIAVHAGLAASSVMPIDEQLEMLRSRVVTNEVLQQLSGRKDVLETPKELEEERVLVVSGHHGWLDVSQRYRLIVDECGGFEDWPLAAVVLPARRVIRDTDSKPEVACLRPQAERELVAA